MSITSLSPTDEVLSDGRGKHELLGLSLMDRYQRGARGHAGGDTVIDDDDNTILDVGAEPTGPVELKAAIDFVSSAWHTCSKACSEM